MDWLCWIGLGLKLQGGLDIYKGVILSSEKRLWDFTKNLLWFQFNLGLVSMYVLGFGGPSKGLHDMIR